MSDAVIRIAREALGSAITDLFLVAVGVALFAAVLALLLPQLRVRSREDFLREVGLHPGGASQPAAAAAPARSGGVGEPVPAGALPGPATIPGGAALAFRAPAPPGPVAPTADRPAWSAAGPAPAPPSSPVPAVAGAQAVPLAHRVRNPGAGTLLAATAAGIVVGLTAAAGLRRRLRGRDGPAGTAPPTGREER